MKNLTMILFITIFMFSHLVLAAGPGTTGGALKEKIDQEYIEYLMNHVTKSALKNYLISIQLGEIADPIVKGLFASPKYIQRLIEDIEQSTYVMRAGCRDEHNVLVSASAKIGEFGGDICFDSQQFSKQLSVLDKGSVLVQLAAVALHEHIHHLQEMPNTDNPELRESLLMELEIQAYRVSVYLLFTAKLMQPSLVWSQEVEGRAREINSSNLQLCDKYRIQRRKFNFDVENQQEVVNNWQELHSLTTRTKTTSQVLFIGSAGLLAMAGGSYLMPLSAAESLLEAIFVRGFTTFFSGVTGFAVYASGQIAYTVYDVYFKDKNLSRWFESFHSMLKEVPFYTEKFLEASDAMIKKLDAVSAERSLDWTRTENALSLGSAAQFPIEQKFELQAQKLILLKNKVLFIDRVLKANQCQ